MLAKLFVSAIALLCCVSTVTFARTIKDVENCTLTINQKCHNECASHIPAELNLQRECLHNYMQEKEKILKECLVEAGVPNTSPYDASDLKVMCYVKKLPKPQPITNTNEQCGCAEPTSAQHDASSAPACDASSCAKQQKSKMHKKTTCGGVPVHSGTLKEYKQCVKQCQRISEDCRAGCALADVKTLTALKVCKEQNKPRLAVLKVEKQHCATLIGPPAAIQPAAQHTQVVPVANAHVHETKPNPFDSSSASEEAAA